MEIFDSSYFKKKVTFTIFSFKKLGMKINLFIYDNYLYYLYIDIKTNKNGFLKSQ